MQITVRNDYRAEVLLSAGEMEHYGITYEEMDYSDAETRRMLWALVSDIKRLSGFTVTLSGRLLIEVIKEKSGSIRICFSQLDDKSSDPSSLKQLIKNEAQPVIAEFTDIENAIAFSFSAEGNRHDGLYEKDGRYRVMLFPDDENKEKTELLACEFGIISENPRLEKALCLEKWNCIIKENALGTLRRVFSES